jgi:hypothetical protein
MATVTSNHQQRDGLTGRGAKGAVWRSAVIRLNHLSEGQTARKGYAGGVGVVAKGIPFAVSAANARSRS